MEQSQYVSVIVPTSPAAVSPQKNLTGTPRIARDIAADLYNNIQKWNSFHVTGGQIVKQIANLKSNDPNEYNQELEQLTNKLLTVLDGLKKCKDVFDLLKTQTQAVKQLLKTSSPLFISLSSGSMAQYVHEVANAYISEFEMKEFVLENIPHARSLDETMFFGACWVYQIYVTDEINFKLEALLTETGHRKIL